MPLRPDPLSTPKRGVVAVIVRDEALLVIRRSAMVVAPGAYCFPGGAIEAGETEEQALVREAREELRAIVVPQRRIWTSVTSWGVELSWWRADLVEGAHPEPEPSEVESIQWCTPAEMLRLPGLLESNRQFLEALARRELTLHVASRSGTAK